MKNLYALRFDTRSVAYKPQRRETLHCVQGDSRRAALSYQQPQLSPFVVASTPLGSVQAPRSATKQSRQSSRSAGTFSETATSLLRRSSQSYRTGLAEGR